MREDKWLNDWQNIAIIKSGLTNWLEHLPKKNKWSECNEPGIRMCLINKVLNRAHGVATKHYFFYSHFGDFHSYTSFSDDNIHCNTKFWKRKQRKTKFAYIVDQQNIAMRHPFVQYFFSCPLSMVVMDGWTIVNINPMINMFRVVKWNLTWEFFLDKFVELVVNDITLLYNNN